MDRSSTDQYRLTTNYLNSAGTHSILKFKATIFFPEKVVPKIIMNKNSLWIELVYRMTPWAMVLKVMVKIKMFLLP